MNGVQRVCIYCLKVADKNAFNREHVIEDSMTKGAGIQGNLTLAPETHQSCVCIECNHYFGRELDQSLGRDSFEAMLRSEYGLLKPNKGKPPVIGNSSRLKIKTADGNSISIRHEVNERVATVHAHIRTFNNSTQKYDCYQIDQLSGLLAEQPDMMFEAVNCTDEDFQRINEMVSLKERTEAASETAAIRSGTPINVASKNACTRTTPINFNKTNHRRWMTYGHRSNHCRNIRVPFNRSTHRRRNP